MTISPKIFQCIQNARTIVKDCYSFIYLMSEHQADVKNYNLGKGAFASAISLLATINLLAKMHFILVKGKMAFTNHQREAEYNDFVQKIKEIDSIRWAKVKQFLRKPRPGDVNESDAFVSFIAACPIDFGIDKEKPEIARKVWAAFRNKLTHIVSLAGDIDSGQILMGLNIQPSQTGMYLKNINFIRSRLPTYKPFDITLLETIDAFSSKQGISSDVRQMILKDKCHVERLVVAVHLAIDWIFDELEKDKFLPENVQGLNDWIEQELEPK